MRMPLAILALTVTAVIPVDGGPQTGGTGYSSLEAKLRQITIPEVDFRNARVGDVFEFVVDASREYDTRSAKGRKGVNIILNVNKADRDKTVTFKGRNFSILELVRALCTIASLDYTLQGNFMMVTSRGAKAQGSTRVVRTYVLPLVLVREVKRQGAKKYFEEMGVRFPEGASAKYNSATSRLIVVNTPKYIQMLDKIIRGLGGRPAK